MSEAPSLFGRLETDWLSDRLQGRSMSTIDTANLARLLKAVRAAKEYRDEWKRPGPEADFAAITRAGQVLDDALKALLNP